MAYSKCGRGISGRIKRQNRRTVSKL